MAAWQGALGFKAASNDHFSLNRLVDPKSARRNFPKLNVTSCFYLTVLFSLRKVKERIDFLTTRRLIAAAWETLS